MLWLSLVGHVPAKSNNYEAVSLFAKGGGRRCGLRKRPEIVDFEQRLTEQAEELVTQLGKTPYPTERVELQVIWHRLYHDGRRRDLDNIMKSIKDALTNGKIWTDDSQVSHIDQQMLYDAEENEWIELIIQLDPLQPVPRKKRKTRTSSSAKRVMSA